MEKTRSNITVPAWLDAKIREYAIANGVSFTRVVTEAICRFFEIDPALVYFRRRIAPIRLHPAYGEGPLEMPGIVAKTAEDAAREHGPNWTRDMARSFLSGDFTEDQIPQKWRRLILEEASKLVGDSPATKAQETSDGLAK